MNSASFWQQRQTETSYLKYSTHSSSEALLRDSHLNFLNLGLEELDNSFVGNIFFNFCS